MKRRSNWLLIIVLLGVLASGVQLTNKGQLEPLARQVGLAVDAQEVTEATWWPALQAAGVHFALVTGPEQLTSLPVGVQPVAVVSTDTWPRWRALDMAPAAIIFADNHFTSDLAQEVRSRSVPIGLLEFKPQTDFAADPNSWAGQLIRVYDQPAHPFISEFTIAVRERQVDLAVVRLDPKADPPLTVQHVEQVSAALAAEGHQFATRLQSRAVLIAFNWVFWTEVLALGALAAWMLSLMLGRRWHWALSGLSLLAVVAVWALERLLGPWQTRQFVALAAALAYPSAGILWWWASARPDSQAYAASPTRSTLFDFAVITAFALCGGLAIHALLSEFAFHLNILQFMGVKVAYALPLAFAFLLVLLHWLRYGLGSGLRIRNRYVRWVLVGLVLLVFLLAVYVLLNRTGNQSKVRILPIELEFRDWLYRTFWVRPRTKEFLGYPVLLLGLYLWRRQVRLLGGMAVLLGFIAELSLVNTFEHLHHPILLSLTRAGLGLGMGVVFGLLALAVLRFVLPAREGWR